jgi:hypothetical protein
VAAHNGDGIDPEKHSEDLESEGVEVDGQVIGNELHGDEACEISHFEGLEHHAFD